MEPLELFFLLLGVWWLCIMPGAFFFASLEAISEWIEAKARELRKK